MTELEICKTAAVSRFRQHGVDEKTASELFDLLMTKLVAGGGKYGGGQDYYPAQETFRDLLSRQLTRLFRRKPVVDSGRITPPDPSGFPEADLHAYRPPFDAITLPKGTYQDTLNLQANPLMNTNRNLLASARNF